MHYSRRLIVQTLVFSRSYLHRHVSPLETLLVKREELLGREMANEFCLKMPDFHITFRDLLHAVNLRHGTNGFTSLPKEGVLRIFSGFEPANLGTKGQHATSRPPKPLRKDCKIARSSVSNNKQIGQIQFNITYLEAETMEYTC